jgi:hypothetical protein
MAGKLVQVDTETVTSAVASVTLTGIDSDDVYMVAFNNILPVTDGATIYLRVTTSGVADSDSEYDRAFKVFRTATSYANVSSTNQTFWYYNVIGTAGNEQANGILYLYNFNNSSEYSFFSFESAERTNVGELQGVAGGGVHTVAETNDGIQFFMSSGNIASGTFTLYKVV